MIVTVTANPSLDRAVSLAAPLESARCRAPSPCARMRAVRA